MRISDWSSDVCSSDLDVLAAELAVFAEMGDQRGDAAVEQAFDQALAFAEQPGLAFEHGVVEVPAALAGGAHRAFAQPSVQQRLDRGFLPLAADRKSVV